MVRFLKKLFGLSESGLAIRAMVNNCRYNKVRVGKRGNLSVDPSEVLALPGFREAAEQMKVLVKD